MKPKITTIKLVCSNCSTEFHKDMGEYKRRLHKLPNSSNFFCSRSCGTSHRNKNRADNGKHLRQYQFAKDNCAHQIYDQRYTWYIHRLTTDSRSQHKFTGDREQLQQILDDAWVAQDGKCGITGVRLVRRIGQRGITEERNPFRIASIDRIDGSRPYEKGNIQWTSVGINLARRDCPYDEFVSYFKDLVRDLTG